MGYQLRHAKLGIYQGSEGRKDLWHPVSMQPESGYAEFEDFEDAEEFRSCLVREGHNESDLVIEEYDIRESERMKRTWLEAEVLQLTILNKMMDECLKMWEKADKAVLEGEANYVSSKTMERAESMRDRILHPNPKFRYTQN